MLEHDCGSARVQGVYLRAFDSKGSIKLLGVPEIPVEIPEHKRKEYENFQVHG
jgi:hypothetical protein